jgi:leucyl/phenylalanyl-tRNA---protein transferase
MREFTSQNLLLAYREGLFPMADSAQAEDLFWVEPVWRGIIPLETFALSTSLKKAMRKTNYTVRLNHDFEAIIKACASHRMGQENTWINAQIKTLYGELFSQGHCHTLELYEGDTLVGGLYGLGIGGAFFGESMFHTRTNASKIALAHLVARLKKAGYSLLDTQFVTPHLLSLGAIEIKQSLYKKLLHQAFKLSPQPLEEAMSLQEVFHSIGGTNAA